MDYQKRKSKLSPTATAGPSSATPTTFFLTDSEPCDSYRKATTPPPALQTQRGMSDLTSPSLVFASPTFSVRNSFSSLLDSDSESIISSSPPLKPTNDASQTDFDNFLSKQHHLSSSLEEHSAFFNDLQPQFRGFKRSTEPREPESDRVFASRHIDLPPDVSNSTAFSAALGYDAHKSRNASTCTESTETPQLILPRLSIASRRPFTSEGLALGKLKILVAGDSGAGKSHLIRSLAQSCQHIVHLNDTPHRVVSVEEKSLYDNLDLNPDHQTALWEQLASTKPLPFFLTDSRRQSLTQSALSASSDGTTLDRNVCFVDTIGYGSFSSATNCISPVVSYLESTFDKSLSLINPAIPEALSILTSASSLSECSLVDVCLYTIMNRIKPIDIEYIRKLSLYTPIIPVIAKADQLPLKDILELKISILKELDRHDITPFLFGASSSEAIRQCEKRLAEIESSGKEDASDSDIDDSDGLSSSFISTGSSMDSNVNESDGNLSLFPCAVSSALAPEAEMVASVLMSPSYVPALYSSELNSLCEHLFSSHGAAWLRYSAGKKFLTWGANKQASFSLQAGPRPQCQSLVCRNSHMDVVLQEPELIINIPDHIFETRRRAQQDTSRWVTELTESIMNLDLGNNTEMRPVISLRAVNRAVMTRNDGSDRKTRHHSRSFALSPQRNSAGYRHSLSIMNLDPLDIWGTSWRIFSYAIKALTVALGLKFVVQIYQCTGNLSSPFADTHMPAAMRNSNGHLEVAGPVLASLVSFADVVRDPSAEWIRPQSVLGALWSGQLSGDSLMSTIMMSLGELWSKLL